MKVVKSNLDYFLLSCLSLLFGFNAYATDVQPCDRFPIDVYNSTQFDDSTINIPIELQTEKEVTQKQLDSLGFLDSRLITRTEFLALWMVYWPKSKVVELCSLPDYILGTVLTPPPNPEPIFSRATYDTDSVLDQSHSAEEAVPCRFATLFYYMSKRVCKDGECYKFEMDTERYLNEENLLQLGFRDIFFVRENETLKRWGVSWLVGQNFCNLPPSILGIHVGDRMVTTSPLINPDKLLFDALPKNSNASSPAEPTTQPVFVWTDSLINARGPFATPPPPEIAQPITVDGMQYWEGGVFVLPGTNVSVLTENGFLDVAQKPGSVMHDYYEARWPVEMKLDSLPLEIRQVRYHRKPFEYPKPWPEAVVRSQPENNAVGYLVMEVFALPGLPLQFFPLSGYARNVLYRDTGWVTKYTIRWPLQISPESAPPEFIYMQGKRRPVPK